MNMSKLKIKIYTRSMNDALYKRSMFFMDLPYEKVRLLNTTADGYLYQMIRDEEADIIINIDEDAFVYDLEHLKSLLEHVVKNGYVNCGMPDGGMVDIRKFNPLVTNPFFNILNVREIRKKFSEEAIATYPLHQDTYMDQYPKHILKGTYQFINNEPYCRFFVWLSQEFKTLYLNAETHPDGESTILYNHKQEPFLIHTWYSRFFNTDRFHTNRINAVVKECGKLSHRLYKPSLKELFSSFMKLNYHETIKSIVKMKKKLIPKN
ncbi:hypothetical protein SDC9_44975 [bioreactor metagenome]|jgi:hypothetical protein|uniref:Uncharacterized protein n=1 Tax=bioreactor metagenome TaxID=1076179 RepID=A0A644W5I6_9ZZZZ|nr:hypothetical protein [Paludibacter sp.]